MIEETEQIIKCDRCGVMTKEGELFHAPKKNPELQFFKTGETYVCFICMDHKLCYPYYELQIPDLTAAQITFLTTESHECIQKLIMKILLKLTSRSRPEKFFRTVQSICDNAVTDNWAILVTLDKDDVTMNNPEVLERLDGNDHITYYLGERGQSCSKIHAINRDMEKSGDWDILISISDDQVVSPGFDERIISDMKQHFPDLDGFLMYNDGHQKDNVSTMSIMGRKYYERFNFIYNPEYLSLWCDTEATEIAHILGKLWYGGDDVDVFKHLHPAWGLAEWDAQYRSYEDKKFWDIDRATMIKHRKNYYGIEPCDRVNGFKYSSI